MLKQFCIPLLIMAGLLLSSCEQQKNPISSTCKGSFGTVVKDDNGRNICLRPTSDAGKNCSKNSQCSGYCVALSQNTRQGKCQTETPFYGCANVLNDDGTIAQVCS